MEHSHGGLHLGADASAWPLALRLVLLLTTALVAGVGVVRPQVTALPRRVAVVTAVLAAVSASAAVMSVVAVSVATPEVAVLGAAVHVALVVAVPLLLGRPAAVRRVSAALALLLVLETAVGRSGVQFVADTVHVVATVVWFGVAVLATAVPAADVRAGGLRPGPLATTLGLALVVAGAVRLVTSGVAFDRRLHETALGLVLLAVVVLPLAVTLLAVWSRSSGRRHGTVRGAYRHGTAGIAYRHGTVGIALSFVAWSALAAVPQPPELPEPGVPVLVETPLAGTRVPVLVSPHRPGRNLVHFPASAGDDLRVSAGGATVPAVPLPGAEGTWAEVDLPAGRGEIGISRGGSTAAVDVDTGDGDTGDGPPLAVEPECASAALGGLLAGRREALTSCPADSLSARDEESLRKLVAFLAERGTPGITLAADSSPRGTKAAEVVTAAAGAAGLRVDAAERPDNALVAISGWAAAHQALTSAAARQAETPVYAHGLYVAPWLLTTPLATSATTVSVPLRFDPREPLPVGYAVAVGNGFGGANPTPAGFTAWLGDRAPSSGDAVRLYAVAQVTAMPMGPGEAHAPGMPMTEELAGQWIPKTTVVPVSAPLP